MTPAARVRRQLGLASLWACAALAHADPIAGQHPPRGGSYQTDWGPATFEVDRSALGRANANATFRFADGTVVWGYFLERPAGRSGAYEFIGRYIVVPGAGGLPHALRPTTPCREPMPNLPRDIARPAESRYWGSIRILWAGSGTAFRGGVVKCATEPPPEVGATAQFTGSVARITDAVRNEAVAQAPTLPRDGPCASIGAAASAAIEPCQLALGQKMRVRLLRNLPKGDARIVFTPLLPDAGAVTEAIRQRRPLPRHPTLNTTYQPVRAGRFWVAGDSADVIAPGATCGNPLWEVSLVDDHGTTHTGLGVVRIDCGDRHKNEEARPPAKLLRAVPSN